MEGSYYLFLCADFPISQRRFFYYLSGCDLPDSYLAYDIKNDHLTLFIPPVDPEDVIWSGMPLLQKEALEKRGSSPEFVLCYD